MDGSTSILFLGGTSYDIQETANLIVGKHWFPKPSSSKKVQVFNHRNSLKIVVAPGFVDYRADVTQIEIKSEIQKELQKHYNGTFHAVVVLR